MAPVLIIVGGFLGAGKTTALVAVAQRIAARGLRVGLITNDQSGGLVDAALVASYGLTGVSVEGGCFCCRLDDLIGATDGLLVKQRPDVLLAEPVGSCTDLIATVVHPLQRHYREQIRVAPFSVLVDPLTLADTLPDSPFFPADVGYLFERQIAEADMLVLTRGDLLQDDQRLWAIQMLETLHRGVPIRVISSVRGDGLDDWLDALLAPVEHPRARLDLDYDRYANAEAALGWLNAGMLLSAAHPFTLDHWIEQVLVGLQMRLSASNARIAHLKVQAKAADGISKASLVHAGNVSFDRSHSQPVRSGYALINVRAVCSPDQLEASLRAALAAADELLDVSATFTNLQSFAPARPEPQQRILVDY